MRRRWQKSTQRARTRSGLATRLALLSGLALALVTAAQAGDPTFADTAAGRAFKARQYDLALAELEQRVAADPGDVLALRYVGITLDRLGRYSEAIDAFGRALAVAPENAATHFHLAVTYYNARNPKQAQRSFQRAAELAPGSLYDQMGRRYLDELARQTMQLQSPGAPRPISVRVDVAGQYDSNIPSAPDASQLFAGKRGGARAAEYVAAEWGVLSQPGWRGAIDGSTYQAQHPDDAFDPFDVSSYDVGWLVQRDTMLGALPLALWAKYDHNWVFTDGDAFSQSHVASLSSQVDETRWTATRISYRYRRDDFADDGFDSSVSSRDAHNHGPGIAQILYVADRRGQLWLGYEYQMNQARGTNFEMRGHTGILGTSLPLPGAIQGDASVEYARERYPDFRGPVTRKSERWRVQGGLTRWLLSNVLFQVTGSWTSEDSTYAVLEYDRWVAGASISYVY